jgi:(1->4)-alpha-D-glucan 1-alpha-D-glucosylmutase
MRMPELLASARLQLHAGFDLHAAAAQVPYYRALGISHLYLSPIAQSRRGSTHGYDVLDPARISDERGGQAGLQALSTALREHGMGAILDIVPNHMAADGDNPWWQDVLRHGQYSRYARYFDIDWQSPASPNRVWLPWLQAPLDTVLSQNALRIEKNPQGDMILTHADWTLPLADGSVCDATADPASLRRVLDRQHYRLAWWRSSADVINYRRFFDIDGLVALDMTCEEAFDAVHALPLRLLAEGVIDGLRVDHVDGLADPGAYLVRLRRAMDEATRERPDRLRPSLHIEKILHRDERLPSAWPTDGTTGYDMMDRIGALLHSAPAAPILARAWRSVSGRTSSFAREQRMARLQWLSRGLRADTQRCLRVIRQCLSQAAEAGDYTDAAVERASADVLAALAVYRTYITGPAPSESDARVLTDALATAERLGHPDDAELRHWFGRLLMQDLRETAHTNPHLVAQARRRFEQLSAPLAAKAVEDTAFYRYGRWLSRNDVGSDPAQFSLEDAALHRDMQWRANAASRALNATATHDHKRGEDVRARLAALSEDPQRWIDALAAWLPRLRSRAGRVRQGDIAMLLQTIVGAWPLSVSPGDAAMASFVERVEAWWIKALREARLRTHWTHPHAGYEGDASALLHALFEDGEFADVRHGIHQLARELDVPGALNGLISATLRITLPGIPDLYQGCDYWDLSLVDPDNRRAVDYETRLASLQADATWPNLLEQFRDGAIKQRLIQRLLTARRASPQIFSQSDYQPWIAHGPAAEHVFSFTRQHGDNLLLVAVPRHCLRWVKGQTMPRVPEQVWQGTYLPPPPRGLRYRDVLSGEVFTPPDQGDWPVAQLFAAWPVAVLQAQPEKL